MWECERRGRGASHLCLLVSRHVRASKRERQRERETEQERERFVWVALVLLALYEAVRPLVVVGSSK